MYPILTTINNFNVYSFGLFLAISFIISTFILYKYSKDEFKEDEYLDLFLFTSIISIIFARAFYIILNYDQFGINILRYFLVRETPGLSLLGGFTFGYIFIYGYSKYRKLRFLHVADIFSLVFSFMLALSKAGEQLGGASYGKETNSFIGIRVIGLLGKRWPVEIIEMLFYLLIFIILTIIMRYKNQNTYKINDGTLFYLFLFLSANLILFSEFLKIYQVIFLNLSIRQIFSLIIMFVVIYPLYAKIKESNLFKKGKK